MEANTLGRTKRRPILNWGTGFLMGTALLLLVPALPAQAQGEAVNLPEIPLTQRLPVHARYAGMGGVSIALADDHSACLANPATLGLVRGIEFSAGFADQNGDRDILSRGLDNRAEFGKTRLSSLGFAYPFPTYRGRFVIGFQYGRISGLDTDLFQEAPTGFDYQEAIFEEGGLSAYAASAAFQVSPNVTLGATGTVLAGSDYRERTFRYAGPDDRPILIDHYYDVTISGITGTLGALVELDHGIRLGMTVHLPENIDFEGDDYDTSFDPPDAQIFNEVDLPFRLGAGLAVARSRFIVAGDVVYADWSQIDFAGPIRTQDRQFAYRETLELRLGGEYFVPLPTPVRLRAGYNLQPLPYRLLVTDFQGAVPIYEEATIKRDRHYFTFGAGFLLGQTLTIDLAYMHGGFERSGPQRGAAFVEEEKDRRLLATMTLRLN